jgi:hypothetical protein
MSEASEHNLAPDPVEDLTADEGSGGVPAEPQGESSGAISVTDDSPWQTVENYETVEAASAYLEDVDDNTRLSYDAGGEQLIATGVSRSALEHGFVWLQGAMRSPPSPEPGAVVAMHRYNIDVQQYPQRLWPMMITYLNDAYEHKIDEGDVRRSLDYVSRTVRDAERKQSMARRGGGR